MGLTISMRYIFFSLVVFVTAGADALAQNAEEEELEDIYNEIAAGDKSGDDTSSEGDQSTGEENKTEGEEPGKESEEPRPEAEQPKPETEEPAPETEEPKSEAPETQTEAEPTTEIVEIEPAVDVELEIVFQAVLAAAEHLPFQSGDLRPHRGNDRRHARSVL